MEAPDQRVAEVALLVGMPYALGQLLGDAPGVCVGVHVDLLATQDLRHTPQVRPRIVYDLGDVLLPRQ